MWSCFDWGHWYSWLQNNNIEDIDKVQWFTINERMTTITTTSRTMKSAINHPQHRSQRQEVGSSASQSHSLQPGMWKVSAELIWYPFANFYRFIYMESFWNWKVSTALIQPVFVKHCWFVLPFCFQPTWFMLMVQCFTKVSSQTCANGWIIGWEAFLTSAEDRRGCVA